MSFETICPDPVTKDLTPTFKYIASLEILVDKMHMAGHTDKWCKQTCDSRKILDLDKATIYRIMNHNIITMVHNPVHIHACKTVF